MKPALLLACLSVGCADDASPPRPPRAPPAMPPRPLALRPGASAPQTELGEAPSEAPDDDLVARCVRRNRESLGPELARALQALADDSLLADSCRLDLAVRQRAPERCASVQLSSLRDTCAFRAAVSSGRPLSCPPAPGLRGRDPVCVALAARDATLCGAASLAERARCLALATGDGRRCETLDPLLRPACLRDLDPLRSVTAPLPRAQPLAPDPALNVWATFRSDASADTPAPWLTRGVFVDEAGSLWVVNPALGWPRPSALGAEESQVGVVIPAQRGPATVLDARLVVPGMIALSTRDGTLRATAVLTRASTRRGGRVAGRITFEGASAGRVVRVELRFDTFVRDLVDAAALR